MSTLTVLLCLLNVFLITVFFALIGVLHHLQQKRKQVIKAIMSEPLYFERINDSQKKPQNRVLFILKNQFTDYIK